MTQARSSAIMYITIRQTEEAYKMALSKFKQDEIAFELAHETKRNVAPETVSIQDALAVACAALRINGAYLKDTRRFSCLLYTSPSPRDS